MVAISEEWSEVGLLPEVSKVPGKAVAKVVLMKARSSLASVGELCLLVQVNMRSRSGNSMSSKVSITLLKRIERDLLKLALFLSDRKRVRLKSPTRSQG